MIDYPQNELNKSKVLIEKLISAIFYASTLLSFIFLIFAGIKIIRADEEQESTVSVTIGIPQPTATATPGPTGTAAPGATATPTPTPTRRPGVSPSPSPSASPPPAGIFKIYGYAPSDSQVILTGIAVSENTTSRLDGYFEFTRLFFPTILSFLSGYKYPELCLYSLDEAKRMTSPVCIPALPLEADTTEVGPILLSPTLEIERGSFASGEQAKAVGKTVPDAQVNIYLAREKSGTSFFDIVKEVFAYTIPTYQITSNSQGNFEFNLPNDADTWRLFAGVKVLGAQSAKSNTLTFNVRSVFLNWLITILEFIKKVLLLLRPYWLYLLILVQIVIIILLIRYISKRHKTVNKVAHAKPKSKAYTNIVSEYKKILEKKS